MQVGLFLFSLVEIKVLRQKFLKLIKVQDGISVCRLDFYLVKRVISAFLCLPISVHVHLNAPMPTKPLKNEMTWPPS